MPRGPDHRFAKHAVGVGLVALLFMIALAPPALAQWQITSPDGNSSVKFGYLFQGRAEWEHFGPDISDTTSQNLYLRRLRILVGGKINDHLTFFAETDAPNLGKAAASSAGTKDYPDVFLQDAMATWSSQDALLLDFGLLLTPGAYNHIQSAATLLALDYSPYTFVEGTPLNEKIGRDVGVQARGILFQKHVEYRAALLQGLRGPFAQNSFRVAGHLAFTPFEAANTLFYNGTSVGKKKALSVGVGGDAQRDYQNVFADLFVDYPFNGAQAITLQGELSQYDGGDFLGAALYKQKIYMVEAGLTFIPQKLTPFVQVAGKVFNDDAQGKDERSLQLGLAYWLDGHKSNIKAGYTLLKKDGSEDRTVYTLQCQAFSF